MKLTINKSINREILIDGCRKNHRHAQQEIYNLIAPKMLGVCRRYINDKLEAEGVMMSGFLKVFDKIDQFTDTGSFEAWIRKIMVNECLLYIRKNKNMYLEVDLENAVAEPNYELASTNLDTDELLLLIDKLPVGYKTVFNMFAIEGYSHKEISEMLDITESTSKSQLSRARKLLQKQLLDKESAWDKNIRRHGKA